VTLKVPKLRRQAFETTIIERYCRRESSVEDALIENTWPASRCAGSKTSPRRYGTAGPPPRCHPAGRI
jgi:hypothetical protein